MPYYNQELFLQEAIDSILQQSYNDFELILINDGSLDNSYRIATANKDNRIVHINLTQNYGNNYARNCGLESAKGVYIALADSDDISHKDRIKSQVFFLNKRTNLSFCYSSLICFGKGIEYIQPSKQSSDLIKAALFFKNIVWQPSVMLKKKDFQEKGILNYDVKKEKIGDYDLWQRATQSGLRAEGISFPFVRYRLHNNQIGNQFLSEREHRLTSFYQEQLMKLSIHLSIEEVLIYQNFIRYNKVDSSIHLSLLFNIFSSLPKKNNEAGFLYPQKEFNGIVLIYLLKILKRSYKLPEKKKVKISDVYKEIFSIFGTSFLLNASSYKL